MRTTEEKARLITAMREASLKKMVSAHKDNNTLMEEFERGYTLAISNALEILLGTEYVEILWDTYMKGE